MKNLIIVESPSKAKTIKNFLDKTYEVVASKGHIRDLPKRKMGIKYEEGKFEPEYVVSADHKATVSDLKKRAKASDTVYIATDEDREGEAIGYHITKVLGGDVENYPRIVFHEVTKKAINEALENPRKIDMDKVDAQQARRLLDRLVGYNLSPLLASKIQRGLSAGRVQSSSLKLIVDKEREIQAFKPVEYWSMEGLFEKTIESSLDSFNGKKHTKMTIENEEQAREIYETIKNQKYILDKKESKQRKTAPQPPFMTSTLQQSASTVIGYSPKKTMMLAQKLYEGVNTPKGTMGVITYMRTDSLYITPDANKAARDYIEEKFGKDYLAPKTRVFKSKSKGAQEAHEAIRPTDISFTPEVATQFLKPDELKLYRLIYNRFVASQMKEALFDTQNLFFKSENAVFKANGRKLVFAGFYKLMGDSDKDKLLPDLKEGQEVALNELKKEQHFTEPPSRYSEAGLVKTLESLGIGRPSTYAPTISTLSDRGYIEIEKKQITPTKIAFTVTEMMEQHFDEIVNSNFTANIEEELDKIEDEKKDWQKILADFYEPFIAKVKTGKTVIKSLKVVEEIGEDCPDCSSPLVKRSGRFGEFISCSTYPKCKYTRDLGGNGEKEEPEVTDLKCDKCGEPMVIKSGRRGKFYACSGYPKCKNTQSLTPPTKLDVPCPKCGGELLERASRRGKFFGCGNYPKCDFISKYPIVEKKCPECNGAMAHKTLKTKELLECLDKECKYKEDL
ncbi:MAG: type I DNA topoisomerase [Campylobacterales bacterium]|nr:type I DNA topoisomerase [Campylobacterales bacterium]